MKKFALSSARIFLLIKLLTTAGISHAQNNTLLPNSIQIPAISALNTCSTLQKGQLVFLTADNQIYYCNGSQWQSLLTIANVANTTPWLTTGDHIYNSNTANVGIGTTNPSRAKLEIQGVAGSGNTNAIFGTGLSIQQNLPTIGFNQYRDYPAGSGKFISTGYASIQSFDPNSGTMAWDMLGFGSANNLTGSSVRALSIYNNGNMAIRGNSSTASLTVFRGTGTDGTAVLRGTTYHSYFNYASGEHTFLRAGKSAGIVYINDMYDAGNVYMGAGNTSLGINTFSTTGAGTLVIHQRGQEGIGLINDWGGYRWEINNENYNDNADSPTQCLTLRYSGRSNPIMGWFRPDNGGYNSNSDRRLKQNIEQMPGVLEKVMQLKPSRYQFITGNPNAAVCFGFIAQEVKNIFPETVDIYHSTKTTDAQIPDLHGLDYNAFSVIAIKAIQEQQLLIEELRKEVEALKKK